MMKRKVCEEAAKRRSFFALLLLSVAFVCLTGRTDAQGWSFTATLTSTGPCGAYMPPLPTFNIPYMATQSYCESLRQTILSYRVSQPMYDGNNYIGDCAVFYTCTPCTGADIATSSGGQFDPGSVSIDGLLQGSPFFTPHETGALENWMNDYTTRLRSMGFSSDDVSSLSMQHIPLTGDANFDEYYVNQIMDFEKSGQSVDERISKPPESTPATTEPANAPEEVIGTTVQLLTTPEEQKKRDEWMDQRGFNNPTPIGADNAIDENGNEPAGMTWREAGLREFVGSNTAGSYALEVTDGVTQGSLDAVKLWARGDIEGAKELGVNLAGKVAVNSAVTVAKEAVTDFVTGAITGPILGLVKGAGKVVSVINTSSSIWDTKHGQ